MQVKYSYLQLCLKALTLVGALLAAIWTVGVYFDSKEKEYYTEFWNTKMTLFQKTSKVVSIMTTTTNINKFNEARAAYWELFYGELSLVEGECVKQAMIKFSSCVPNTEIDESTNLPFRKMEQPAYVLSIQLKTELANAWEKPFSELSLDKAPEECVYHKEKACL